MYKFCKINLHGKEISHWVLEIDNVNLYIEWSKKYQDSLLIETHEKIKKRLQQWREVEESGEGYPTRGHYSSSDEYQLALNYVCEVAGTNENGEIDLVEGFSKVSDELLEAKLNALKNGDTIYVYKGCQWFTKHNEMKIVEEIIKESIEYPEFVTL